jgi:hypothetical protein
MAFIPLEDALEACKGGHIVVLPPNTEQAEDDVVALVSVVADGWHGHAYSFGNSADVDALLVGRTILKTRVVGNLGRVLWLSNE